MDTNTQEDKKGCRFLGAFLAGLFSTYAAICAVLIGVLVPVALIRFIMWLVVG